MLSNGSEDQNASRSMYGSWPRQTEISRMLLPVVAFAVTSTFGYALSRLLYHHCGSGPTTSTCWQVISLGDLPGKPVVDWKASHLRPSPPCRPITGRGTSVNSATALSEPWCCLPVPALM